MIAGTHTRIRFSEPADAGFYRDLYLQNGPKAALLDARREFGLPTRQEIQELLKKSESSRAFLFTVEDDEGRLRGWCGLRALNVEAAYCELFLVFSSTEDYAEPLADETMGVLLYRAFKQLGLRKILATCLDSEGSLRDCLARHGFASCGVQRDVLYSGGRWQSMDTFVLTGDNYGHDTESVGPGAAAL